MVISIYFEGKLFVAKSTGKGFFARMRTHVIAEAYFPGKELLTDKALVFLLPTKIKYRKSITFSL